MNVYCHEKLSGGRLHLGGQLQTEVGIWRHGRGVGLHPAAYRLLAASTKSGVNQWAQLDISNLKNGK